jgi:phosphocarrier protein
MLQATTTISNKLGLHARASAKLTKLAGGFPCEVWIAKGDTDGDQAQEALDAVLALIADKFGEGE